MRLTRSSSDDERAIVIPLGEYGPYPQRQLLKLDEAVDVTPPDGMVWRVEGDGWVASLSDRRSKVVIQGIDKDAAKRAVTAG